MLVGLQYLVYFIIILTAAFSVYYSIKHRREKEARLAGLYAARMNISMGIVLVMLSVVQLPLFPGSTVRIVLGTTFLLLGLFNFFAGVRNHAHFNQKNT